LTAPAESRGDETHTQQPRPDPDLPDPAARRRLHALALYRLLGDADPPTRELRHLFRKLSFWSGWPIELVLPADAATDAWFDSWTTAIDRVPVDHLHVRFDVSKPTGAA